MFAFNALCLKRSFSEFDKEITPSKRKTIQEVETEADYIDRSNQILDRLNQCVDFSEKESYLKGIVHRDSYAKYCLAELYLQHGMEYEQSYTYLQDFLESLKSILGKIHPKKLMSKDYGIANGLLAEKYLNLGEFENAEKHIREGMKHGSLIARCAHGDSLRLQKRFIEAESYWNGRLEALKNVPNSPDVQNEMSIAQDQLKVLQAAIALADFSKV